MRQRLWVPCIDEDDEWNKWIILLDIYPVTYSEGQRNSWHSPGGRCCVSSVLMPSICFPLPSQILINQWDPICPQTMTSKMDGIIITIIFLFLSTRVTLWTYVVAFPTNMETGRNLCGLNKSRASDKHIIRPSLLPILSVVQWLMYILYVPLLNWWRAYPSWK